MYIPRFYRAACDTQPYAAQGWLELSKMEEECGQQEPLEVAGVLLSHGAEERANTGE